jgi:hypothetical protein
MTTNRPIKKMIAFSLAATAAAVATQVGTQPVGAGADARPAGTTTNNQGNPNAVPPILRPARPSELAAIRRAEAKEGQEFYYHLPPTARYSNAEMDVYASLGN